MSDSKSADCPWCGLGSFHPGARRCSHCGAARGGIEDLARKVNAGRDPPLTMGGQGKDAPTGADWPLVAVIAGVVALGALGWYWIVRLLGWCAS